MAKQSDRARADEGGELVAVGDVAPAFDLADQQGQTHKLSSYRGQWVVLYFYPKDDTPGCTTEACELRDDHSQFRERGAVVFGVSPDDTASHAKFAAKYELPFTLLADPEKEVCQSYGVWQEKNMYGLKRRGVVRTTYLIDPKGKVAHRWDKVKAAGHAQAVLSKLDELQDARENR